MPQELNISEALSRLDGDSALLAELARLFLEEGPKLLANLQTTVAERDVRGIETYAHSLKGSVSNFGPSHVHDYAFALEQKGRGGDMTGIDELFRQLHEAFERFMCDLEGVSSHA
jgi:HPt (histidine-containing phosphotransfer) domain-containing protein